MKTAILYLAALLLLGALDARAAVGFSFGGVCYVDTASALAGFKQLYPMMDSYGTNEFVSASVAGSVLTYNINNRPLTANVVTARTGTLRFQSCAVIPSCGAGQVLNATRTACVDQVIVEKDPCSAQIGFEVGSDGVTCVKKPGLVEALDACSANGQVLGPDGVTCITKYSTTFASLSCPTGYVPNNERTACIPSTPASGTFD